MRIFGNGSRFPGLREVSGRQRGARSFARPWPEPTSRIFELQARRPRGSRQVVGRHLAALRAGTTEPVRAEIPGPRKIPPGSCGPGRRSPRAWTSVCLRSPRLPGHRPVLRPRPGLRRPGPPPARMPAAGVDPAGGAGRTEADEGLRLLKRATFGRSSLDLLRTRILTQL